MHCTHPQGDASSLWNGIVLLTGFVAFLALESYMHHSHEKAPDPMLDQWKDNSSVQTRGTRSPFGFGGSKGDALREQLRHRADANDANFNSDYVRYAMVIFFTSL